MPAAWRAATFRTPINYTAHDELGYLARSFDLMSTQLASLVQQDGASGGGKDRRAQSQQPLAQAALRLDFPPLQCFNRPESYRKVLDDLEEVLGLSGSMLCQCRSTKAQRPLSPRQSVIVRTEASLRA